MLQATPSWTTTKKLGIDFVENVLIFIGNCGSKDGNHYDTKAINSWLGGAHTHMCPVDPLYKAVCISSKSLLLNSDGTPSDILVHELAHVITSKGGVIKCLGRDKWHDLRKDFKEGHSALWEKVMKAWGKTPSLTCTAPY